MVAKIKEASIWNASQKDVQKAETPIRFRGESMEWYYVRVTPERTVGSCLKGKASKLIVI